MTPRDWVFAPRPCSVLDERGRVERGFHDSDSGWEILESFEVRALRFLSLALTSETPDSHILPRAFRLRPYPTATPALLHRTSRQTTGRAASRLYLPLPREQTGARRSNGGCGLSLSVPQDIVKQEGKYTDIAPTPPASGPRRDTLTAWLLRGDA
jgi:hypothetical protein